MIDFMAIKGINMPLAITGLEAVWRRTLLAFGVDGQEAREFLCGPAYLAWQWMTNMEGVCGPLPKSWIDQQQALMPPEPTESTEPPLPPAMAEPPLPPLESPLPPVAPSPQPPIFESKGVSVAAARRPPHAPRGQVTQLSRSGCLGSLRPTPA